MDTDGMKTADAFGAGLVLDESHCVNVVIMVGNDEQGGTAAVLSVEVAQQVITSLMASLVQKAIETMPQEAALQYMENWARRQRDNLN
jgi:hypothetical protein